MSEEKKVPKYREIRISQEKDGSVKVDFWPDLFVVPTVVDEPTTTNPEVKLSLGTVNGKVVPLTAKYPPGTKPEELMSKIDLLFSKIEWCPSCERKKRAALANIQKMMEAKGQGAMFEKIMQRAQESAKAKPPAPAPQKQFKMENAAPIPEHKRPLPERVHENVQKALDDTLVAVRGFFIPPVKLIPPDEWVRLVREKGNA